MRTPTFAYMGGKARLSKWLIEHFPQYGRYYTELFVGRGNVFFKVRENLKFERYFLNDIDISFFNALLIADLDKLPEKVLPEEFEAWKNRNDDLSKITEPRISFCGKGYAAGYSGDCNTHIAYRGHTYKLICLRARELLKDVDISQSSFETYPLSILRDEDFVYCDPPYLNTLKPMTLPYPNIDHKKLINILNQAEFKWALSGYDNELYKKELKFKNKYQKERNSEIQAQIGKYCPVIETLWTSY